MDILFNILLGLGLSAAVGFRIFIPFLALSLSSHFGWIELSEQMKWLGSSPALMILSTASVLEILAYYIPFIDNLLDTISVPAATVGGAIMMGGHLTGLDPLIQWTLAIIAGGGAAGTIGSLTALGRAGSSVGTAGTGNFIFTSAENSGSILLSILSLVMPFVAAFVVITLIAILIWWRMRRRRVG